MGGGKITFQQKELLQAKVFALSDGLFDSIEWESIGQYIIDIPRWAPNCNATWRVLVHPSRCSSNTRLMLSTTYLTGETPDDQKFSGHFFTSGAWWTFSGAWWNQWTCSCRGDSSSTSSCSHLATRLAASLVSDLFCLFGFVLLNNFALRHYCGHFGRKEGEVPFAPNIWPVSAGRRSVMTLWYSDNLKHTAEVGKDCKNLLLLALYHPCLWGGYFLRFLHGFDQTKLIKANTIVLSMTWILSQAVFFVFTLQQFSCFKEIIPATPMFIVMIVR